MAGSERIFISRAGADKAQAEWIARALEAAGYVCVTQDRDFDISESFPADMREAFESCDTMLALMSPDYWQSRFCMDEWDAAYARDRAGQGRLIPVMLRAAVVPKLFASLTYLDLATAGEDKRSALLVAAVDRVIRGQKSLPDALEPAEDVISNATFDTPHFTGRDVELERIHDALWSGRFVAVRGLSGGGKSALTKEYAKRHREKYAGVWLVRASKSVTLHEDLAQLGRRLGLKQEMMREGPGAAEAGAQEAVRLAKQRGRPFLILLDNVEYPNRDIPGWLKQDRLHLLASSWYSTWPGWAVTIDLQQLPEEAARSLLLDTSGRPNDASLDRLAGALEGLPLALVQTGAYLRENPSQSFDQYLADLESRLGESPDDWKAEDKLVAATFEPSIMHAESSAPGARALLTAAALFAPDNIPIVLLSDDPDAGNTRAAIDALSRFSLWRKGEPGLLGPVYSLHRLLMRVVRSKLDAEELHSFVQSGAARMESRFSGAMTDAETWQVNALLAPHAVALMRTADPSALEASLVAVIGKAGQFYAQQAWSQIDEAVQFYRRVLEINESILGPSHLEVADSLSNLAIALSHRGNVGDAESLFRRALDIRDDLLGPEDPSLVPLLSHIGAILQTNARSEEAETAYRRAINIIEQSEPFGQWEMPAAYHGLAVLLSNTGRAAQAIPFIERAVVLSESQLDEDNEWRVKFGKDYVILLQRHGAELSNAGQLAEALPFLELAQTKSRFYFEAGDEARGAVDYFLAATLHSQGVLTANAGEFERAIEMLESAFTILHFGEGPMAERRDQIERDLALVKTWLETREAGGANPASSMPMPDMPDVSADYAAGSGRSDGRVSQRPRRTGQWLGFALIISAGAALLWVGLADPFGWFVLRGGAAG